jgi:hypothetical protein
MKIKNSWVVFGAILVFVVLGLCAFSQAQPSANQTREDILNLIPQDWKAKDLKAMESLADQIIKDNVELAGFFEKGDKNNIEAMTARYAQMNGTIVDHKYKAVSSKDKKKVKTFWSEARTKGPKLEFKTVSIYLTDKQGPQVGAIIEGGARVEAKFNYVAVVVQEFSYGPKGAGGSNNDPLETLTYCHQDTCPWRSMCSQ